MGDTTRIYPGSGIPKQHPEAGLPAQALELQFRIACNGKSSAEVLDQVSRALTEALAQERDPLLVLEDLGRLQDSVMSLVKGLSRLVYKYPRPVACWESSGFAEAFLSIMDASERPAAAPEGDLEPPYGSD